MACLSCYLLGSGFLLLFLQLFRLRAGRRCASQGARQDTLLQLAGPRQLRQPEALEAAPVRSRRRRSRSPGLLQLAVGRGQRSLGALLGGSSEEEAPAPAPMPAPKKSPSGSGSDSGSSESEPTPTHALELSEPEEPEPTPVLAAQAVAPDAAAGLGFQAGAERVVVHVASPSATEPSPPLVPPPWAGTSLRMDSLEPSEVHRKEDKKKKKKKKEQEQKTYDPRSPDLPPPPPPPPVAPAGVPEPPPPPAAGMDEMDPPAETTTCPICWKNVGGGEQGLSLHQQSSDRCAWWQQQQPGKGGARGGLWRQREFEKCKVCSAWVRKQEHAMAQHMRAKHPDGPNPNTDGPRKRRCESESESGRDLRRPASPKSPPRSRGRHKAPVPVTLRSRRGRKEKEASPGRVSRSSMFSTAADRPGFEATGPTGPGAAGSEGAELGAMQQFFQLTHRFLDLGSSTHPEASSSRQGPPLGPLQPPPPSTWTGQAPAAPGRSPSRGWRQRRGPSMDSRRSRESSRGRGKDRRRRRRGR